MIYLINEHGHFFCISEEVWEMFDSDRLQRAGCVINPNKEALYQEAVKVNSLCDIDEVEGNEINICLDSNNEVIEICPRGISSLVEEDNLDDWLAAYQL